MDNIKTIAWEDFLALIDGPQWGPSYSYDSITLLRAQQEKRAQAFLDLQKVINDAAVQAINDGPALYFRITAGAKAGTIMRLTNPNIFKRYDLHHLARRYRSITWTPPISELPNLVHNNFGDSRGSFDVDGNLYIPGSAIMNFEIEGQKNIQFSRASSTNRTTKAELLIGYQGPTVWSYGKPVKKTITLTDRFGQEVGVGDVVLLGQARTGVLMTGKITKISDAKGVWIKHIGSKEDHHEKSCSGNQLMLLKNIEQVLMMEKLRSL